MFKLQKHCLFRINIPVFSQRQKQKTHTSQAPQANKNRFVAFYQLTSAPAKYTAQVYFVLTYSVAVDSWVAVTI